VKSNHESRQFSAMKDRIRDGECLRSSGTDDARRYKKIRARPFTAAEKKIIAINNAAQDAISKRDSEAHFAKLAAATATAEAVISANVQIVADFFAGKTAPASTKEMRSVMYAAGVTVACPGEIFLRLFPTGKNK